MLFDLAGAPYGWGEGAGGRVGDGTSTERLVAVAVSGGLTGLVSIAAGNQHSCAASPTAAYCWGIDGDGALGTGGGGPRNVPVMTMVLPPP